jgi:hypothetical protein
MSQSNPNYSYDTITITSLGDDNLQQDLFKISDLDDNMSINLSDLTYQSNITASTSSTGMGSYSIGAIGSGQYTYTTGNTSPFVNPVYSNPIIGIGGSGGAGTVLTTGMSDTIMWGSVNTNPGLKVNGDAEFEGDVKIKGKSITEMLDKIEERLAILHPNPELEDKWDELKELGKRYKELEQEIIEKEKVWAILKK